MSNVETLRAVLVAAVSLFLCANVFAVDDQSQAVINHIVAIEGARSVKDDAKCGYALNRTQLPRAPYREITNRLSQQSREELERELLGTAWQQQVRSFGEAGRQNFKELSAGLDERTACGMLAGAVIWELGRTGRLLHPAQLYSN